MRNVRMASYTGCMWCCAVSLTKIVTLRAGPFVSIGPPVESASASAASSDPGSQADGEVAEDHAPGNICQANPPCAVAHRLVSFVLEARKCSVSPENARHQEQAPVGMGREPLRQERHQDSNEQ